MLIKVEISHSGTTKKSSSTYKLLGNIQKENTYINNSCLVKQNKMKAFLILK